MVMEMGSNSSSESLNGLKFGKKIYFEDVGVGAPVKSGGGSSSAGGGLPPPSPAKKGRGTSGGVVLGGQPPRCQVEGCKVDLSDAKSYYSRHKVCGIHSKTPTVVVSGIEQRFCQQCSRFHQLPEFDQGKRSCRRRLAGHNERRRKPPPGSLVSTRYSSISSSIFENSSGSGGFVLDFTTYPTRASDQVSSGSSRSPAFGKFLTNSWQSNSESPPPELQGSANRTTPYPVPGIPSGGCYTGVSDSSCALSLLSNQPSRNRSLSLGANYLLDADGAHLVQPPSTHSANNISHVPSSSWGFKGNEVGTSSLNMHPELGLGQMSQPGSNQYTGDPQLTQQSGTPYMDHEHSRAYNTSAQYMHWSL